MQCEVIKLPVACERDRERRARIGARHDEVLRVLNYMLEQSTLLTDVARPYDGGWVTTEAACLQRRTKADYLKMFRLYSGDLPCDFLGFRDKAEAFLCEEAALEAGSAWLFIEYFRQDKEQGGTGLGSLNDVLAEYTRCFVPGLLPCQFPEPPSTK